MVTGVVAGIVVETTLAPSGGICSLFSEAVNISENKFNQGNKQDIQVLLGVAIVLPRCGHYSRAGLLGNYVFLEQLGVSDL